MSHPIANEPAPQPAPEAAPEPKVDSANTGGATAVQTPPSPKKPPAKHLPPFKVLLHNDDHNEMQFVVETLVELTPLNKERAVQVMFEADNTGCALVLVTHLERAELYREQFTSKGLTATIEPAE